MIINPHFSILITLLIINFLLSNCLLTQLKTIDKHDNDIILKQSPSFPQQNEELILTTFKKGINFLFNCIRMKQMDIPNHPIGKTSVFEFTPGYTYLLEPKCESIQQTYSVSGYPVIIYSKCSVLVIMESVKIENSNRVVATLDNYLTELYYENIEISLQNKLITFKSFLSSEYKYIFNENESLFDIMYLKSEFISKMKKIGKSLHEKFYENIIYYTRDFHLESFLRGVFNVLYLGGPFMYTTPEKGEDITNKVTYISYGKPILEDIVITKKKIFTAKLTVYFEYAINYDINCNEGYFVLYHADFETSPLNYSEGLVDFEPINLNDVVKSFILNHFSKKFTNSIKDYINIGNQSKN